MGSANRKEGTLTHCMSRRVLYYTGRLLATETTKQITTFYHQISQVSGSLKYISSGDDIVVGVNANDEIYRRDGISRQNPTGTSWTKLNGGLKVVDAFNRKTLWGVNSRDYIYHN